MRCECYKCRENNDGFCLCSNYITIDVNGQCDSMYIPVDKEDGDGNG